MQRQLTAAFLAILAVAAVLGFSSSARASSVPLLVPLLSAAPLVDPEDPEDAEVAEAEEEEIETCEEDEEADQECAESTASQEAPDACVLKSAEASVLVLPAKDRVRLTLRYTAFSPAVVSVQYGLRGRKGNLKLGSDSRRFSRKGVFRETKKLSEAEMARVNAATEFDVRVRAVNTPGYCRALFDRELTSKRAAGGSLTWTD